MTTLEAGKEILAKEMTPDLEGYKEYLALNDIIVTAGKNLREGYHE